MLNIQERQNGDTTILELEGNVIMGGGSAKLREAIAQLINEDKTNILLNFQNVKYIDSSGTGEILSGINLLNQNGGRLKISNLTPKVEEVFTLSSILPLLEIYDKEESAIKEIA
ncbi:STAS domain-containing protein [soil metagenome]